MQRRLFPVLTLLLAVLTAGCGESGVVSRPTPPTPSGDTENVGIPLEEGVTLRGRLFGPQHEIGVILSHMRPNDQSAWFEFAEELADEGYAALTFDFRGYGETGGDKDFGKLDEDLAAALRFMRDRGKERVFLIGASMGGTASLVVAAQEDVAGVVAVSAPSRFEDQDGLSAVPDVTEPKLFIASEDDTAALGFEELLEAAGEPKEQEVYSGNAHGTNLLQSEHAAAFRQRILQFLQDHGSP